MAILSNSSDKKKKYFITTLHKLNYPEGSKLIFFNENLFHLYKAEDRSPYKCSYIYRAEDIVKLYNSIDIDVNEKLVIYRREFSDLLNIYHNTNNSEKYWGLIIDQFLIILLKSIILNIKLFKKIKFKYFNKIYKTIKSENISNFYAFKGYVRSNDYKELLSLFVLKELNSKFVNLKYKNISKVGNKNKIKIYILLLRSIIRLYISFFKPILIVNGYIGLKNSIQFFFKSLGRIINVPENLLFYKVNNNFYIDQNFRQRIIISEKDIVDKIFNKIIGRLFPVSYLENFNSIKKDIKKISKKIKIIGTGNCHYYHDHFNILTSEILKRNNGKLLIFQHGGAISKTNNIELEHIDQKYASTKYYFDNPKGLGMHFFSEKKISFAEIKKRNSILILNTTSVFESNIYYQFPRYTNLDPSQVFFSNLNKFHKKKVLLKLFPQKESFKIKESWKKNFGNKINFLPILSNAKKEKFYKAKLVILNDISTPLWELLFCGLPFILICNKSTIDPWQYKKLFIRKIVKLKKINVFFNDPVKAADFVNSLDKDFLIEEWWKKINSMQIFLDFKNFLIIEKRNYLSRIVKDLRDLNK
jgi:putative transferase (TIGR04331 family)